MLTTQDRLFAWLTERRTVKKTPLGGRFIKQLIRVNDQVCFAALQQWEFTQHLNPLIDDSPKRFTTDVFSSNPFAKAIYRRVGELPDFSRDAEEIALQMGIVAAVEYVLAYMEEIQLFRERLIKDCAEPIKDDAEEEQLRLKISRWCGSSPKVGYFRTLGYFRLLRNHYAHVNETPSSAFKAYMRSHGTPLNSFWDNGVTDVHGIDFRALAMTRLTPDLAFGVMNLLRVCVQHVDEMIAGTVSIGDAVRWTVLQIKTSPQARHLPIDRLSSKVAARLRMEWNLEEPSSTVVRQVEGVISET
jgi:hypothetical protein